MISDSDVNEQTDDDKRRLIEERERILRELEELSDLEDDDGSNVEPQAASFQSESADYIHPKSPIHYHETDEMDYCPSTPGKNKLNDSFCAIDEIMDKSVFDLTDQPSGTNSADIFRSLKTPDGLRSTSAQGCIDEDQMDVESLMIMSQSSEGNSRCDSQQKYSYYSNCPEYSTNQIEKQCPYSEMDDFDAELEELLEKPVEEQNNEELPPNKIWKNVLERIDHDRFNRLPEGWTMVTHHSGMPMFLHKTSRVITHSRPYKVDSTIRDHAIPISAVPCLYRKRLTEMEQEKREEIEKLKKEEEEEGDENKAETSTVARMATHILNGAKVGIVENHEDYSLSADQYQEYCSKLFKFKKIMITRYGSTTAKIEARKEKRVDSLLHRAGFTGKYEDYKDKAEHDMMITAPSGAILIDVTPLDHKRHVNKKPFLLNPTGRSTVTVLNEFMQRLVKGRIEYECEDNRNVTCPYKAVAWLTIKTTAILQIGGTTKEKLALLKEQAELHGCSLSNVSPDSKKFPIGRGIGHSKKFARLAAARDALSKLIPALQVKEDFICEGVREKNTDTDGKGYDEEAMELFDKLKVESKNVTQLCAKFGMTKPFSLLRDAVSRSIRWNGMNLECNKDLVGNGSQLSKVTLKLGDMEESAEANGVKPAMQLAAQMLLKKLNPELESYGSFLRLFGGFEDKALKETAKKQHDEVVRLQNKGSHLQPNHAVLTKLKEEMRNVALIHPPRQFLYGFTTLSSNRAGISSLSMSTQTEESFLKSEKARYSSSHMNGPYFMPPPPPSNVSHVLNHHPMMFQPFPPSTNYPINDGWGYGPPPPGLSIVPPPPPPMHYQNPQWKRNSPAVYGSAPMKQSPHIPSSDSSRKRPLNEKEDEATLQKVYHENNQ